MPVARPLAPADSYVVGRLDVTTAADLRADLLAVLDRRVAEPSANGDDLVVDLSGVDGVDMVGVGLLVGVHRQAQRRGRRLVLTGVPPRVMRLLTATRLRRVLAVRDLPRPAAPRAARAEPMIPIVLDDEAFAI
jgi:anti-anti-sigma factor